MEIETFGLPGLELRWRYSLEHEGQAGHSRFRHGEATAIWWTRPARDALLTRWRAALDDSPLPELVLSRWRAVLAGLGLR